MIGQGARQEIEYEKWDASVIHRVFNDPDVTKEQKTLIGNRYGKASLDDEVVSAAIANINWQQQSNSEVIPFKVGDKDFYMLHTTPLLWCIDKKTPLIVDSVIFAETPDSVREKFEIEVNRSEQLKHERTSEIAPFLQQILGDERVKLMMGRGSAYDDRRTTHEGDDVDVMLFIDWTNDEELAETLLSIEKAAKKLGDERRIKVLGMSLYDQSLHYDFNEATPRYVINLDLIPFWLIPAVENSQKAARHVLGDDYTIDMFTHAVFLGGNPIFRQRILDLCRMVDKRKHK